MLQTELIALIQSLQSGQVLVVEAEAGSGKTWTVMQALLGLADGTKVFVSAPTHVAVEELAEKLAPGTRCEVLFGTSASLAGRFLVMNKDTGELENRFAPVAVSYDLVVMDEAGATPSCDIARALSGNSPMVLLGDREQLSAVRSRMASVWTDDWQSYEHRSFTFVGLDEQHRAEGELYDFVSQYRNEIVPLTKSFKGGRVLYSVSEFEDDFFSHLRSAYESGQDLAQYCMFAYRNETVSRLQLDLRQRVFGSNDFVQGEVLRVESAPGLPTGRLAKVLAVHSKATTVVAGEAVPTCELHVEVRGQERWLKAVHPAYLAAFGQLLEQCKLDRNWAKFFELEGAFSVLVNANVMTAHKAQGRTVRSVWTHVADIGSRRKLLYVSYGRAAKNITAVWPMDLGWKHGSVSGYTKTELDALRGQLL